MKVAGVPRRTILAAEDGTGVEIIDQTLLPHEFATLRLTTLDAVAEAIRAMRVRGAPLIGVTAAYGLCFAVRADPSEDVMICKRSPSMRCSAPPGCSTR